MCALVSFVQRDPAPEVLVVTNVWPEPERPVYGIFVQRQVESLRRAGLRCDVLYIRGYASVLAYPLAAVELGLSSLTWRGRYRLVHAHAGEAALAARFHVGTPMLVSVSTVMTVARSVARASTRASRRSAAVPARTTWAPRLAAFAARSTASVAPACSRWSSAYRGG